MTKSAFNEILAEICKEEIKELNKPLPFKPSLRHKFAMKRIFSLFEKNKHTAASESPKASTLQIKNLRISKRLVILFIVIFCAVLFTGFIFVYVSKNFYGTVYTDHMELFVINDENCPTTIEHKYFLPNLPDGFEIVEQYSLSFVVSTVYEKESTGEYLHFSQYPKCSYSTHLDTEHRYFEEIEIDGHNGLCIIPFEDGYSNILLIWDNGDYIMELIGDFNKKELIDLAESAEILKN